MPYNITRFKKLNLNNSIITTVQASKRNEDENVIVLSNRFFSCQCKMYFIVNLIQANRLYLTRIIHKFTTSLEICLNGCNFFVWYKLELTSITRLDTYNVR